tara:strand:- start:10428 stop:12566 length:2139 start_codon:yes stop_codon:yes gene_type:complete
MSQYLSGLAAGQRFREDQEERRDTQATKLVNLLTPYTKNYKFGDDGSEQEDFKDVSSDNFLKLTGIKRTESGELDYSGLKSIDENFYQVNNNDLITRTINSLSTARSYTDINDQKTKEGTVVNVRVNKSNGAIHYDLKTDQGIVPKTLGFSNDPKDVVMSSDLEGFRTLFNTAVNATYFNSKQASYEGQYQVAADNFKKFGGKPLPGSEGPGGNALESIAYFDRQVSLGNMKPAEAFQAIGMIGTEISDTIDAFNVAQSEKTDAASEEFDRAGQTLTKEQAENILRDGQFFDQPGDIQRQMLSLLPNNLIGLRTGLNKEEISQLRDSTGDQKMERKTGPEGPTKGLFGQPVQSERPTTTTALTEPQPDTITQGGVEYQRTTPNPDVFQGTDLKFPTEGTIAEQEQFITENQDELLKIGVNEEFLKQAETVFNRLEINTPQDMVKLNDPSVGFGRVNAALAYAMAAGGTDSPANFLQNYQAGLNMITNPAGDVNISATDRADRLLDIQQTNQARIDSQNAILLELRQQGREDEADFVSGIIKDAQELDYFVDYEGDVSKYLKTSPKVKRDFRALLNNVRNFGGPGKSRIRFDKNGLVDPNSITAGTKEILSQEIGRYIGAFAVAEGTAQEGGLFGTGLFSDRENLPNIVGDIAAKTEIRTEVVNGREQIKEIVIKDPRNNQYVPIMTGNQFREQFPDAQFSGMALSVLTRAED